MSLSMSVCAQSFEQLVSRALQSHLAPAGLHCLVNWHQSIDSTNTAALALSGPDQAAPPLLIGAFEQTQGRGRRGRTWASEPGASLTMSLVLERMAQPGRQFSSYSLVVALALVQALAPRCSGLTVKWPNDILRDGKKCVGLLIETRQRLGRPDGPMIERLVIGLGLNLVMPPAMQSRIGQPVTGLFDEPLDQPAMIELICALVHSQLKAFDVHQGEGFGAFVNQWVACDGLFGQSVVVLADPLNADSVVCEGVADGVNEQGALRVLCQGGLFLAYSGEVSVRRVKA
jgi:BirA family transcriptional regulator, biotin operon repressor / biotin---[acetyl-CoA-carboxylase] ligase